MKFCLPLITIGRTRFKLRSNTSFEVLVFIHTKINNMFLFKIKKSLYLIKYFSRGLKYKWYGSDFKH